MRVFAVAAVLAAALAGGYALLGGGGHEPTPVADPCAPRERPRSGDILDPAQRATLAVIDGAACELGVPREQALLDLLRERNPAGVTDGRLKDAVLAGIDRAVREDALGSTEAALLRLGVRLGGVEALLRQLRG